MPSTLLDKLRHFGPLSPEDERLLIDAVGEEKSFEKGEDIVREGSRPTYSSLLISGVSARYGITTEGKRQITAIHIAGDFVDLHSFIMKRMDHGIVALVPCRIATVPHAALDNIVRNSPHLAKLLWLNTLVDGATHRAWLVAMGRLLAKQHLAHLICEMYVRYEAIGQTDNMCYRLPISQAEIGDALGLSIVHVNRCLKELRNDGLVTWERDVVCVLNWEQLQSTGDFDPTFLQVE